MNFNLKKQSDYFSLTNTNCLKGILAICVCICHLWGSISANTGLSTDNFIVHNIGRICTSLGYLSVACFFFLSGYGLMYQYQKKGKEYLNGFLFKRVMPLYLVCIIFIAFYACTNIAFGEPLKIENVVQSFLFGGTIISKGWYLQSIILWYVLFFLSFNFVKEDNVKFALLSLSFVLYVVLCLCLQLGSIWYEGCFSLLLGVAFAKWKEKIDRALSTRYILYLILLLSLFAVTFVFGNSSLLGTAMRIISKCISASLFPMIVVLLLQYVKINNIITAFLGKLYLEIYILHGFFLQICYSKYITIKNPLLYGVTVFTGTIVASLIIHPGLQKILALGRTKGKKVGK